MTLSILYLVEESVWGVSGLQPTCDEVVKGRNLSSVSTSKEGEQGANLPLSSISFTHTRTGLETETRIVGSWTTGKNSHKSDSVCFGQGTRSRGFSDV